MFASGAILSGKYRLVRVLGEGGMGAVWHARNEAIDRDVAIKVMQPELMRAPEHVRRFFTEAKVCGGIRHPGIVDVLDVGTHDGAPFIVMELLDGDSLESVLFRRGRLPCEHVLPVVRDVARTIQLA